jgi:hypothetical protein
LEWIAGPGNAAMAIAAAGYAAKCAAEILSWFRERREKSVLELIEDVIETVYVEKVQAEKRAGGRVGRETAGLAMASAVDLTKSLAREGGIQLEKVVPEALLPGKIQNVLNRLKTRLPS